MLIWGSVLLTAVGAIQSFGCPKITAADKKTDDFLISTAHRKPCGTFGYLGTPTTKEIETEKNAKDQMEIKEEINKNNKLEKVNSNILFM